MHLAGAFIDDIVVKSGRHDAPLATTSRAGRTAGRGGRLQDQHRQRGSYVGDRYYLLENRTYVGYDATLAGGSVPVRQGLHGARPRGAVPVPGRPARVGGRRDLHRQQHDRPPGARPRAPGRRASGEVHLPRRHRAEQPAPAVRRDLRAAGDRRGGPAQGGRRRQGQQGDGPDAHGDRAVGPGHPDVQRHQRRRVLLARRTRSAASRSPGSGVDGDGDQPDDGRRR